MGYDRSDASARSSRAIEIRPADQQADNCGQHVNADALGFAEWAAATRLAVSSMLFGRMVYALLPVTGANGAPAGENVVNGSYAA